MRGLTHCCPLGTTWSVSGDESLTGRSYRLKTLLSGTGREHQNFTGERCILHERLDSLAGKPLDLGGRPAGDAVVSRDRCDGTIGYAETPASCPC